MDTSYPTIQRNPQDSLYPVEERPIMCVGRITIVLAIIIIVGSLIANGCFYSQLGNYSFAIGAGGLALGVLLLVLGRCAIVKPLEDTKVRQNIAEQQKNHDLKQAEEDAKALLKEEADRKAHDEKIEKEREEAQAQKQAELEAKKNGHIDSDEFRTSMAYRTGKLRHETWYSNDSVKNQELIGYIDDSEFDYVKYEEMPDTVQKDCYEALMKGDVKKAQKFFSNKLSSSVIQMMEESHIAILYGEKISSVGDFDLKEAYKKLTPEMVKKLLKSILENWELIPGIKNTDKGFAIKSYVAGFGIETTIEDFAVKLIHATKGLSPEEKTQEFERIFDLLMNTKFRPKLSPLLKDFAKWQQVDIKAILKQDALIMTEFPLFFVQKIWHHPDREALILALFTEAHNLPILENILPWIAHDQRVELKNVFTRHNANFKYHSQLMCLN